MKYRRTLALVTATKMGNSRQTYVRAPCKYTLDRYGKLRIGRCIMGQQATVEAQDIMPQSIRTRSNRIFVRL